MKPQVRTVPGVTEVNSIGGYEKQYHVTPGSREAARARAHVPRRVRCAGAQQRQRRRRLHRALRRAVPDPRDRARRRTATTSRTSCSAPRTATPLRVRDVAAVGIGKELRTGAATDQRRGSGHRHRDHADRREQPHGLEARRREDGGREPLAARRACARAPSTTAPTSSRRRFDTVRKNLLEGALLVDRRPVPLARKPARGAHRRAGDPALDAVRDHAAWSQRGISGNLMSLGAIDFGIIVDGAVVMVENIVRRFARAAARAGPAADARGAPRGGVRERARGRAARRSSASAIIMIVYLPILTLVRDRGEDVPADGGGRAARARRRAHPHLHVRPGRGRGVPAGPGRRRRRTSSLRALKRVYGRRSTWALRSSRAVVAAAPLLLVLGAACWRRAWAASSCPSSAKARSRSSRRAFRRSASRRSVAMQGQVETAPARRSSRTRSPTYSRAPAPRRSRPTRWGRTSPTRTSCCIRASSGRRRARRRSWPKRWRRSLQKLAGQNFEISQPIELRFNELIAGVRSDLAVKVFGDELEVMTAERESHRARCFSRSAGRPTSRWSRRRGLAGAHHRHRPRGDRALRAQRRRRAGGRSRPRSAAARWARSSRATSASTSSCGCRTRSGATSTRSRICRSRWPASEPPSRVRRSASFGARRSRTRPTCRSAPWRDIQLEEGPNQVSREDGKRRVVVQANVRGRDLGSFVAEAQRRVARRSATAARLLARVGRPVREPDRGAATGCACVVPLALAAHLRAALHDVRLGDAGAARVHRRAARADGRRRSRSGCAACRSRSRPASASSRCRASRC